MRLRYDRNNPDLVCFINNASRNANISLNDISRLKRYITKIVQEKYKEFSKSESSNNFVRVYMYEKYSQIVELKMFINKITFGQLDLYDDDKEYILSVKIDKNNYLNIYIKHYIDRKVYSVSEFEKNDIKICKIYNDELYSRQNHLIFDISNKIEVYDGRIDKIDEFLNNWKSYYELQLENISNEKDTVVANILLDEFRNNIQFWESIKESNVIYFPIKINEFGVKLRSTSLIIKNTESKKDDLLKDYINIKFKILSKNKAEDFFVRAVENFNYDIKCDVGYIENDEGINMNFNKILNRNIVTADIKRNLIGDITRVKRIVEGIDLVINSEVTNESLIHQIVNNKLVDGNDYKIDDKRIDTLIKMYNLNDEQALIVDKILNMNDLFLVQGPPGTGKTTIISVKELDKLNKKVLLTSNVSEARLNIIERIKGEKELIIKVYTDLKPNSEKHEFELKDNKIRYIQNQIIEKFSYDNIFISSPEEYNNLLIKQENYSNSLSFINKLNEEKNNFITSKITEEEKLKNINQVRLNVTTTDFQNIYNLIVNDNLDNIKNDILGSYLNIFFQMYNSSEIPKYVNKINYHKEVKKQINLCNNLYSKISLYKRISINQLTVDGTILGSAFINKYLSEKKLRRLLFNLSNVFSIFEIDGKNKKDAIELCEKCDNVINCINTNIVNDSYIELMKQFVSYIDSQIMMINTNITNYEKIIKSKELDIDEENNKNYNTNEKLNNITKFINEFDKIKNKYKDIDIFYNYLNDLKELINEQTDKKYVEQMLSGKYFDEIFEYYSSKEGNILSMSTNQVAKYFENSKEEFDYIIVDEASKCNFNDLIISLSRTKKLVLIGDYLQLDPVKEKKDAEFINDMEWDHIQLSNFSQLIKPIVENNFKQEVDYDKSNSIGILKKQYRMSKEIFEIISKIYDAIDGFGIENSKVVNPYYNYRNVLSIQCDGVESNKTEEETSRYNETEINYIYDIMKILVELSDNHQIDNIKNIGIISFYKLQASHISNKVSRLKKQLDNNGIKVQIGTVDNFQGREFDLVIVSCVRTELTRPFLTEIRRWNVSISRAKDKLIILGNFKGLYHNSRFQKVDSNLSQTDKELAVIYNDIIPMLNTNSEKFTNIENVVKEFIRKGND